jgi:hypothetical protein
MKNQGDQNLVIGSITRFDYNLISSIVPIGWNPLNVLSSVLEDYKSELIYCFYIGHDVKGPEVDGRHVHRNGVGPRHVGTYGQMNVFCEMF